MADVTTDCRSEDGITVGLVDALVAICRILAQRDLTPVAVQEALHDLVSDEDLFMVFALIPAAHTAEFTKRLTQATTGRDWHKPAASAE